MFDVSSLFALAAALSWTLAGIFGHKPSLVLGSLQFNRIRMGVSMVMLLGYCLLRGKSIAIDSGALWFVFWSGLIGAALGDYFLFKAMQRLGPRRTGILFAANAPIAAVLGWVFLRETLSVQMVLAILLGFLGIILAVVYGKRRDLAHIWEAITPPLWLGVMYGMLAALGQAVGVLLMRPVMAEGLDPAVAGFFRVLVAACAFWAFLPLERYKRERYKREMYRGRVPRPFWPDKQIIWHILGNGFFGMAFGMALLLKALESGSVASVSILAATSPLMMLPFVWAKTRLAPPFGAWAGAVLVVFCAVLLI